VARDRERSAGLASGDRSPLPSERLDDTRHLGEPQDPRIFLAEMYATWHSPQNRRWWCSHRL
jgi:hypothetical protein